MRSALPPFAALETFLAVARTGVTLTVGPVVASLGLTPFVAELEDDHPGLVLHLVTTTRLLDLNAMGIEQTAYPAQARRAIRQAFAGNKDVEVARFQLLGVGKLQPARVGASPRSHAELFG